MPNEYIEREILSNTLQLAAKASDAMGRHDSAGIYASAASLVAEQPAADVAPVVHGAWEWYEQWSESNTDHPSECDDCGWKCSECGSALSDSIWEGIGETVYCDSFQDTPKMKVCPNCYARMDGGEPRAD